MNAVVTKSGTVHAATEVGTACGTKAAEAKPTADAITCKRCAAKAAKVEVTPLFELVTAPATQSAEASVSEAERLAARAARRDALVAKNWADTKAKAARARAEELAAERYAMATNAAKLAEAEANRAKAAKAELAAKRAAVAAKAENLAKLAAERAEVLAKRAEVRAAVSAYERAEIVKAARIRRELELMDYALGGAYVSGTGASMTTNAKAALSEDDAMVEAARHMGRDARALAESWADAKDEYRVTRAARLAARMTEVQAARPKELVQAYRNTKAYRLGRETLTRLGRGPAAVVVTRLVSDEDAASGLDWELLNRKIEVFRPVAVPANLNLTVQRAEVSAAKAAKRLAELDAKADATKRTKAAEVSAKAEAKVQAARAEAGKWAEVPAANGWALVEVAKLAKVPTAKQAAKLAAELGARADDTTSYVLKAAPGRVFNDTTARSAFKAANGTVTAEAKRAATRARVAAFKARKRAEAGLPAETRAYNMTTRNAK